MKSAGALLAIVVNFLAGFIMSIILIAGSLVLLDQAIAVGTKIWRTIVGWSRKAPSLGTSPC